MPLIAEIQDITAYYDASRVRQDVDDVQFFGELDLKFDPPKRWPVRNREPREPIDSVKRAIIHQRDGEFCRDCGSHARFVVDHIIPRSAFLTEDVPVISDRSDNLVSMCWDCNQSKSNFEHRQIKKMGVTRRCWDCMNPWYSHDDYHGDDDPRPDCSLIAYCGSCGITTVPNINWIL